MSLKKRVLILGPFAERGGREIEAVFIAQSCLERDYDVRIISTTYMPVNSLILSHISSQYCNSVYSLICANFKVYFFALFSYLKNICKLQIEAYAASRVVKKFCNYDYIYYQELSKSIEKSDLVLFLGQISSLQLEKISTICTKNQKPFLFRMTGYLDSNYQVPNYLKNVTAFIHQSENNFSENLLRVNPYYVIIDQAALFEEKLLAVSIRKKSVKHFLVIGELSEAKGSRILASLFKKYSLKDETLTFIGRGNQLEELKKKYSKHKNINFIGQIPNTRMCHYFSQNDCLIIASCSGSNNFETGPFVGIEAMAAGKIIMSTRVGAMQNRLSNTENDFWFDIENPNSFKSTFMQLRNLTDEDVYRIATNVRHKYISYYSKDIVSKQYLDLIKLYA